MREEWTTGERLRFADGRRRGCDSPLEPNHRFHFLSSSRRFDAPFPARDYRPFRGMPDDGKCGELRGGSPPTHNCGLRPSLDLLQWKQPLQLVGVTVVCGHPSTCYNPNLHLRGCLLTVVCGHPSTCYNVDHQLPQPVELWFAATPRLATMDILSLSLDALLWFAATPRLATIHTRKASAIR